MDFVPARVPLGVSPVSPFSHWHNNNLQIHFCPILFVPSGECRLLFGSFGNSLIQIRDNILYILDAHRNPHGFGGDAGGYQLLL